MVSITEAPEYRDNAKIYRVLIWSFHPTDFVIVTYMSKDSLDMT